MNTQSFSDLLNRIKSLVLLLAIIFVVSACTQGNSTVSTQQQSGDGIVVPSALLALPKSGTLTAYISVDEGDRQPMIINGGMASVTLSGISEGSHTFTVEFEYISGASSSDPGKPSILARANKTIDIGPGSNTLNIDETDYVMTGFIAVSAISGNSSEDGNSNPTFTVVLTSPPTNDVSIDVSSSDVNEGTVDQPSITFTSTDWDTAQIITVTGVDDDVVDGDVGYTIILSATTSADPSYDGVDPDDVDVINSDGDVAGFAVSTISNNTSETGDSATFSIELTSIPAADVSMDISSSNTNEGRIDISSITFTPGNWNSPQTITVTGMNDDMVDGNQPYAIQFTAATSADSLYANQRPADVAVVNVDDDSPGFNISPISRNTGEDGTTATFTARLTTQPTANVVINISSSNINEGTVGQASITFSTANWNVPQTITVRGENDDIDDGNLPYSINLAAATSADNDYNGLIPGNVAVTNTDDDNAGFTVSSISGDTSETGTTATFTIVLISEPTATISIGVASSNTNEGSVDRTSITFDASNWTIPQTITVTGENDTVDDGDQLYSIILAAVSAAGTAYNGLNPNDVTVTNTDDDGPPTVTLSINNASIGEASESAIITATLSGTSAQVVTVNLSYSGTSTGGTSTAEDDYTASTVINIAGGSTTGTTTITATQDLFDEADETIVVDISSVDNNNATESGTQRVTTTINDDDQQPTVTLSINTNTPLAEAAGAANLTATLSERSRLPVTVNLIYSGTATAGADYSRFDSITIPVNNTIGQVAIMAIDDSVDETNETIIVDIDTITNGLETTVQQVNASIADDDVPVANFTATIPDVTEGMASGTTTLTISLDQASASDVSISFTVAGTATIGADHNLANGTMTIAVGELTGTINFTVQNDNLVEANETIIVTLGNPVNAALGATTTHTVTIIDNDNPGFNVSSISGDTAEDGTTATFNVSLASEPTANVTFGISSSDATEGMVDKSSITFSASNWNIAQSVTVAGLADNITDGDQSYNIILATATSSDTNYNGLKPDDTTLMLRNIDTTIYTVTVNINGYSTGNTMVLRNNGTDDLFLTADGPYTFSTRLDNGATYNVAIATPTAALKTSCIVNNGVGSIVGLAVTDVVVSCVDDIKPQAIATTPTNGSVGNDPGTLINATYDEDMLPTSFTPEVLILTDPIGPVAGTVNYDVLNRTLSITPDSTLALLTPYKATLANTIADLSGLTVFTSTFWTFTTRDGAWAAPQLIETNNLGGAFDQQIALDPAGNAIAVWQQSNGTRWQIWANRFEAGEGAWGAAQMIEASNLGRAQRPQIAMDSNGNALAVWQQSNNDSNQVFNSIWANRFTATTGTWGTAQLLETNDIETAYSSRIALDSAGNGLVVWQQNNGTTWSIWGNRFNVGTSTWGTAALLHTGIVVNTEIAIAMDPIGNALLLWVGDGGLDVWDDILAKRFDVSTNNWSSAQLIETEDLGPAGDPQIAMDSAGNGVAVWYQNDSDFGFNFNVWTNRFDVTTGTWGSPQLLETIVSSIALAPQIALDPAGNGIAVWNQYTGEDNIYANRYDATAGTWGTAQMIDTGITGFASSAQIALDPRGNGIAVWNHSPRDSTPSDIWANRFDASTNTWGTAQLIETNEAGSASTPHIAVDSAGYGTAIWGQSDGSLYNTLTNRFE